MRERGFTLMEMVAVLFLVGVLLAISPLALDSLIPERELEKAGSTWKCRGQAAAITTYPK